MCPKTMDPETHESPRNWWRLWGALGLVETADWIHAGVGRHQKRTAKYVRQNSQLADIAVAAVKQSFATRQSGEFPGVATDTFLADGTVAQHNAHPNPRICRYPAVHGPALARLTLDCQGY